MNILHAMLGEHGPLRHQLDALRLAAPRFSDDQLRAAILAYAEAIESHAAIEDELVFEPLVRDGRIPPGPIAVMRAEHREIETLLGHLLAAAGESGRPDPQRTVLRLVETVRHHFDHEEHVLFPLAARILDPERLEALGAEWAVRRGIAAPSLASLVRGARAEPARAAAEAPADSAAPVEMPK